MNSAIAGLSDVDVAILHDYYRPLYNPFQRPPVLIHQRNDYDGPGFVSRPLLGALLFDNENSEARDNAAAERTFLSWLRLSVYMAVVAVAILVSFHLKHQPSAIELRLAGPVGIIFWVLSIACLASGLHNYIRTLNHYSLRQAIVQTGIGTQMVFMVVATAIVAACVLFLSTNAEK